LYFAIIVSPFVGFDVYTSNMKQKKESPSKKGTLSHTLNCKNTECNALHIHIFGHETLSLYGILSQDISERHLSSGK